MFIVAGRAQKLRPKNVDRAARQTVFRIQRGIDVGNVDGEKSIVFADGRAEQQRLLLVESHREP